jgi:hypothetical protein
MMPGNRSKGLYSNGVNQPKKVFGRFWQPMREKRAFCD